MSTTGTGAPEDEKSSWFESFGWIKVARLDSPCKTFIIL
jgi:hypothetical protein